TWTGYPSGTWEIDWPDGPKTGGQFFLFATPTTHKLYVGSHNGLGTFDDAANAFVESPSHPDSKLFGGPIYGGGGRLLAVSVGRFSFDDGVTWTAPAPFGSDFGFSFTSGGIDATGTAWALHAAHETTTLYKSTDGTTWTPKPGVDPRPFSVARDGMFFSGDGEILRSSDEGTTWTKLLSLSIGSWFLLPAGPASTLVVSDEDGAEGFVVRVSKDGGATFSDWTYDLPQAPSAFYLGNDHLWATVPDLGLFELVKK
ncbi:MAG: WD40/YVTN/BNR-like repeat-containing protein, partial [Polyangiales bacterium]